jgi:shikimate kinase
MPQFRRIYIIGFMGSGKTTIGKRLAAGLQWAFIDLDREIEAAAGKTINEIFSESGEENFRKMEADKLQELDIKEDTVISVGGGTPCFSDNMQFMNKTGIVVYLRMTPGQLKSRLSTECDKRPLLKNINEIDRYRYISEKLSERNIYYNKASVIEDAINLNIGDLTEKLKTMMRDL